MSETLAEILEQLVRENAELRAKLDRLAGDFCCIRCADGHTPLYCLNCAETMLARNLMR